MIDLAWPVAVATLTWWTGTGVILWLDGLPVRTFRKSLFGATVVALVAVYALATSRLDTSVAGALVAFAASIVLWGWLEITFLMGFVTGPRTTAAPPGCSPTRRFVYAVQAIAYHELAIAAMSLGVIALTWGTPNPIGGWSFVVLWSMRTSAKLNLFLGVRNLGEQFLPDRARYLASFFARRSMNCLFPVVVTAATAVVVLLAREALDAPIGSGHSVGVLLVATLLALAVVEHWMLVLPLPIEALWRRVLDARARAVAP